MSLKGRNIERRNVSYLRKMHVALRAASRESTLERSGSSHPSKSSATRDPSLHYWRYFGGVTEVTSTYGVRLPKKKILSNKSKYHCPEFGGMFGVIWFGMAERSNPTRTGSVTRVKIGTRLIRAKSSGISFQSYLKGSSSRPAAKSSSILYELG